LSLVAALTRQRIPALVLEALPELSHEARASTLHPPTLEMFAEWGVLPEVLARGKRIDHLQFWERSSRSLVADFAYDLIAGDTPYPFRFQCPQSVVTRVLWPHIEATGAGKVLFRHAVVSARDAGTHAEAIVETPNGTRTFTAPWLVGADGSKSGVRTGLGLGLEGKTYPDRFLLVATDLDLSKTFPGMGPVSYMFDPDEWVIVMTLPDVVRVVFRLRPEEDEAQVQAPDAVRERMHRFLGARLPFTTKSTSVYSVHQRVAETFRKGRVLLTGDAAHINNPAGGMGMNSGIHDAHHLAEALATVYRGGSEAALDRYAEERRNVAVQGVQAHTDRNYRDLSARDEGACEARNRELRSAAADPALARAYLLRASMLDHRIDAVIPSQRPTVPRGALA
jgi:3-(3-hydroxy-phenyl)propionate hydroxylase